MSRRSPLVELAEVMVFAPIGAGIELRRRLPELADIGREQVRMQLLTAKGIGAVAASRLRPPAPAAPATRPDLRAVPDDPDEVGDDPGPSSESLPIPEYDALSAVQVVPRLDSLAPDELEAVLAYEERNRGRRTILHRASELLEARES